MIGCLKWFRSPIAGCAKVLRTGASHPCGYRWAAIGCCVVFLTACSSAPRIVKEYRIDVQQGNVLTQEMVSQLKPGLTQDQVRFVLGSPMLIDMFHANRWDYVYRLQKGKTGEVERGRLSVFFDEGRRLIRVAGDVIPAERDDEVGALPVEAKSRVLDLQDMPRDGDASGGERGFFGRMLEKVGL